jgi:radical SAM superfamily enzyme YgiQ (UPF0313 family)
MILNPPSPPYLDVGRDWAGGFGTAWPVQRRPDYGQSSKPTFYPFLAYASAVLSEKNCDFSVLDCQWHKLNRLQVLKEVGKENPDVIISLVALPSLKKDLELLDTLKESLPNTFIAAVGTSCRFLYNDILSNSKIDAVLRNSYPYVSNLASFLNASELKQDLRKVPGISYVKSGRIITTVEPLDIGLDKLLPPSYNGLKLDGYETFADLDGNQFSYISILGSKGCPYPCIYCPYPLGFGEKWTRRSPKAIADEIEHLHIHGVMGFLFRDQSFSMNKEHAMNVCEEIIRRKLDIAWFCEARVDQISNEILEIMKKAGCKRINYGVETGDPELIKWGKPPANLDTIRKAFRLTKNVGMWAGAHIILGWPDENLETLARTVKFVSELPADSVNWNVLTPYPGTRLYEMANENNLILTTDWSKYTSRNIVMKTKFLSAHQLCMAKNKIVRNYWKQRMRKLLLNPVKKPRFVINELEEIFKGNFM